MSRCCPFPPPGYEKKTRPNEDANLLIKENHKDKKQKNGKKDKEKKERREKDKEKSSEKHREKKEKKHKHKDKDKKEKSRDKEERKTSEEKKIVGLSDHQISENFGLTGSQVGETQTSRLLLDFEKKVRNDNGTKEMQIVKRITVTDLSVKSPGKVLEHKVGILGEGTKYKDKREESTIHNGHTVKANATGLANGFVCNFSRKDQRNVEGSFYQEVKMEKQNEQKDSNKHKNSDSRGDKHKGGDRGKKSKSMDKNSKKEEKAKELSSPMHSTLRESDINAMDFKNDKGSYLFKESNLQNGILSKRKEPETAGFLNVGHEIQNKKLPRFVSSSHQVVQTGSRIESSSPGNQFALENEATVQNCKSNTKSTSSISLVEIGRKLEMTQIAIDIVPERKEAVSKHGKANDSLSSLKPTLGSGRNLESCQPVRSLTDLEQGVVTNNTKVKKVLSSHPVAENERKLGSSQFNNLNAAERKGAACNPKMSLKESRSNGFVVPKLDARASRINGMLELEKPSACSTGLPSASLQHKEIVETHMKPPHPDAKYLSEILSVPKVEWSDVDEQKWFSSEDHQAKKPKYVSSIIEGSKQVWAEALQLECADVTALPYVIPY